MCTHSLPRSKRALLSVSEKRMPFERNKEFSSLKTEVALELIRRDADHDMRDVVQRQRLADDVRIGAELVLPEPVSQNHDRLAVNAHPLRRSPVPAPASRRSSEVVGGDKHRRRRRLRFTWSLERDLALRRSPPGHRPSRYRRRADRRSPDRTTCRSAAREPTGVVRTSTSPSVFTPGGGIVEYSRDVRNRDDGRHADSQRHDTHERERPSLRQRAAGINQITPDTVEHIHDSTTEPLLCKVVYVGPFSPGPSASSRVTCSHDELEIDSGRPLLYVPISN